MKLWTHLYQITPPGSVASRSGLLIKREDEEGSVGFADLMSWPELGEMTIGEELAAILERNPTPLGQRVLTLANEDAQARKNKVSFWSNCSKIPESHYFVGNLRDLSNFKDAAFETPSELSFNSILKVKVSGTIDPKILLSVKNSFRLDFNEQGSLKELLELFSDSALREKIDFLEDPFSSENPADWQIFKNKYPSMALYGDYALQKNPDLFAICDGVVLKPATRCELGLLASARLARKKICVTHSMGHPLGSAVAANFAALNAVNSTGLWPSPSLHGPSFDWNEKSDGYGYGWTLAHFDQLNWREEKLLP